MAKYAHDNQKSIKEVTPAAMNMLTEHDWPGNVRELENIVERAVVLAEGDRIEPHHLPSDFGDTPFSVDTRIRIPGSTLQEIEKFAILKTYESTGGNTAETANTLGISVRKVQYKLKEFREEDGVSA